MSDFARTTPPQTPVHDWGAGHPNADDLVLYAMQLLTPEQASTLEQHVLHCVECRAELGRIHGDLAAAAISVEQASPSPAARERLLAQVAREKKIVSAAVEPAPVAPVAKPAIVPLPQRTLADFGRGGSSVLAADPALVSRRPAVLAWAGWAVAASLAVVSGMLYRDHRTLQDSLAAQTSETQRLSARAAQSHQLLDALTDPQAVRVSLAPKAPPRGPVAGVTYNPKKGTLIFLASNLDPLQTYKTYELWVIPQEGAPIPAGTFRPDEHGSASVVMPPLPRDVAAKAFGVTIENEGGSDKPTMPIIMAGS